MEEQGWSWQRSWSSCLLAQLLTHTDLLNSSSLGSSLFSLPPQAPHKGKSSPLSRHPGTRRGYLRQAADEKLLERREGERESPPPPLQPQAPSYTRPATVYPREPRESRKEREEE